MSAGPQLRWSDEGSAALETVLVLPIIALLLVALLGSLTLVSEQLTVSQAARAAARSVALTGDAAAARSAVLRAVPGGSLTVDVRERVAHVTVTRSTTLLGTRRELRGMAVAPFEPVVP